MYKIIKGFLDAEGYLLGVVDHVCEMSTVDGVKTFPDADHFRGVQKLIRTLRVAREEVDMLRKAASYVESVGVLLDRMLDRRFPISAAAKVVRTMLDGLKQGLKDALETESYPVAKAMFDRAQELGLQETFCDPNSVFVKARALDPRLKLSRYITNETWRAIEAELLVEARRTTLEANEKSVTPVLRNETSPPPQPMPTATHIRDMLHSYRLMPPISNRDDPLCFWHNQASGKRALALLALRYLNVPLFTVVDEGPGLFPESSLSPAVIHEVMVLKHNCLEENPEVLLTDPSLAAVSRAAMGV